MHTRVRLPAGLKRFGKVRWNQQVRQASHFLVSSSSPLSIAVLRTSSGKSMQKSKFGCWPAAGRDLPVFWPSEATFLL
jgi:hypothetical protein